jgi:hypothetical protein
MPDLAPQGVKPTAAWADAWEGYALELEILGRSKSTIASRKSNVLAMARYFTAQGTEPEDVTRLALSKYLALQVKGRAGCGPQSLYKDLRMFWRWLRPGPGDSRPFREGGPPEGHLAAGRSGPVRGRAETARRVRQ